MNININRIDVINYLKQLGYIDDYNKTGLVYKSLSGQVLSSIRYSDIMNNGNKVDIYYTYSREGEIYRKIEVHSCNIIKTCIFKDFPEIKSDYRKRQIAKI